MTFYLVFETHLTQIKTTSCPVKSLSVGTEPELVATVE